MSWRLTCDVLRDTNADTVTRVACPTFVTDNETDEVSTGQGKILFEHLTCPKEFRLFKKKEGAEGHCEGMAPSCSGMPHSTGLTHCCQTDRQAHLRHRRTLTAKMRSTWTAVITSRTSPPSAMAAGA